MSNQGPLWNSNGLPLWASFAKYSCAYPYEQLFPLGCPHARYNGEYPGTQIATPTGSGGYTVGFPTMAWVSKSTVIGLSIFLPRRPSLADCLSTSRASDQQPVQG